MKHFFQEPNHTQLLLVVAGLAMLAYVSGKVIQSTDSRYVPHVAMSLVAEHDSDLDEYRHLIPDQDYRVEVIDGHLYSLFPVGTPLLISPLLFAADKLAERLLAVDLQDYLETTAPVPGIELLMASILTTTCVLVTYGTSWEISKSKTVAVLTALTFALATSAMSTASRALWQHAASMLLISISIYLFFAARRRPFLIQFVSLALVFSIVVRPTNVISFLILGALAFLATSRITRALFVSWFLIGLTAWFLYNHATYSSFFPSYYGGGRIGLHDQFLVALAGNLLSPARGLFVFSPILVLPLAFALWRGAGRQLGVIDYGFLLIIVLHWLSISAFPHWWGGWGFGPRLFTDILPYLTFFLAIFYSAVLGIGSHADKLWPHNLALRRALIVTTMLLLLTSIVVNVRGAYSYETWAWNYEPTDVDDNPERLWDWNDPQFLR